MDNVTNHNGHAGTERAAVIAPPVDVHENEHELLVTVDMPGASADSVQVELEKDRLSLSARAAGAGEPAAAWRARVYQRTFMVPEGIDANAITAELSQGVLRVRLPKRAERKPRTIPVRAAS